MTGNAAKNWQKFRPKFDLYLDATDRRKGGDRAMVPSLLHIIGDEGLEVYGTFTWDLKDDQGVDWWTMVEAMKSETFCTP